MKKSFIALSFFALCLYAGGGCSVKQDRSVCPGYLRVNVPEDTRIVTPVGMVGWDGGELFRHLHDTETEGRTWLKTVRRGDFSFLAYTGVRTAKDEGHTLVIPLGEQCDSLYGFHTPVSLDENATVDVSFKKQFSTVRVDLMQHPVGMAALQLTASAGTCGFDLIDFSPVSGAYSYSFQTNGVERVATFRVPRQIDNSLILSIKAPDGTPLTEIDLGEKIAYMGYSWLLEELQDIYVVVDFQYAIIEISFGDDITDVEKWENGAVFSLIQI